MRQGSAGHVPGRTLLAGAIGFLIVFLILTVVVTTHGFDGIDRVVRALVHRSAHPLLTSSMETASLVGGQPGQIPVVCLGSLLLWRRRRRWGVALPLVMAGAGVLQLVAKWAVDRPRPNLDAWGFPSAHVLSLVVLCGYLAWAVCTPPPAPGGSSTDTRRRWRGPSLGLAAAIVGTVAFSRMYLDAHWFSDVLGGFSIGLAYLLAVVWVIGSVLARSEAQADPRGDERPGVDVDPIVSPV